MKKVLIVEDNPLNMELLTEILESKNNYIVETADDGEEALEKVKKDVFDLVVLDIELPGMDGVEVKHFIKNMPEYADVPVIALTAFAMEGDRERFLNEGFDDYISKPIDIAEFVKKINKY